MIDLARASDRDVLEGIERVVRDHLDRDVVLSPETRLVDAIELDSLRRLTLVIEIENHFAVCLDESDEGTLETVADLIAAIRKGS